MENRMKLVFIVTQKKDEDTGGTETTYEFVGDRELEKEVESYFLRHAMHRLDVI